MVEARIGHTADPTSVGAGTSVSTRAFTSLLWPPRLRPAPGPDRLGPRTMADLDLDEIVHALTGGDGGREQFVTAVLAELCTDTEVISYRQAVMSDLLHDPALRSRLGDVRPKLAGLMQAQAARQRPGAHISAVARRVEELERYVHVMQELSAALEPANPRSSGLSTLRAQPLAR